MTRDHRLMELHDGELDASAEVAARQWVGQSPRARAELEQLRLISELVRENHQLADLDSGFTDAIVSRALAAETQVPLQAAAGRRSPWSRAAPALGLFAIAAGIALYLSSSRKMESELRPHAALQSTGMLETTVVPSVAEHTPAGVSIQSVDFGSTNGVIFMVSAGEGDTMVVWTLEDANDKG